MLDTYGIQCIEAELESHESLHEAFEGVDTVYFLAFPNPNMKSDYDAFIGRCLKNVLDTAVEFKVQNFVSLSTVEVYGRRNGSVDTSTIKPRTEYSRAKERADRMIMELSKKDVKVGLVRSAVAIGEYDKYLSLNLARMAAEGRVIIPQFERMSFSHPVDICRSMYSLLKSNEDIKVINVKSFDCSSFQLVTSVSKYLGSDPEILGPGLLRRSKFPAYTLHQLSEHIFLEREEGWKRYDYEPSVDLDSASKEVASWYRKREEV